MADFKPGDKVEHPGYGEGTVTYGPYTGFATGQPRALVQFIDSPDRQYEVWVKDLTARPAFKVGDRAMLHDDAEVTIVFGPYFDDDGWAGYLIKGESGEHWQVSADELSPLPQPALLKAGDRIRILKDSHAAARVQVGDVLTVQDSDCDGTGEHFTTNAPGMSDLAVWFFPYDSEGTGWERV